MTVPPAERRRAPSTTCEASLPVDDDAVQRGVESEETGTLVDDGGVEGLHFEGGLTIAVLPVPGADGVGDLGSQFVAAGSVADDTELPELAALRCLLLRQAPGEVGDGALVDGRGRRG